MVRARDTRKEKIVKKKAVDLLVKHGFDGFSMQKLAKTCNISVATLYIYYKDKGDLIRSIGIEEADKMKQYTLTGFSPDMDFEEGLWIQWNNRARFSIENPRIVACMDIIRHSPYGSEVHHAVAAYFRPIVVSFVTKAIADKKLRKMPVEAYWSVAFGPLYTLIDFHLSGKNLAQQPFKLTEEVMRQAFISVIKGLKP